MLAGWEEMKGEKEGLTLWNGEEKATFETDGMVSIGQGAFGGRSNGFVL